MPVYAVDYSPDVPTGLSRYQVAAMIPTTRKRVARKIASGVLQLDADGRVTRESAEVMAGRRFSGADFNNAVAAIRRGHVK